MRRTYSLVSLLLMLGIARPAHATPLFEMVGGFGGQGAMQARHTGASAASAYFNPALLPEADDGLQAGVLVLNTEIGVSLDPRPAGADVLGDPSTYQGAGGRYFPTHPIPTDYLNNGKPAELQAGVFDARPRQRAGSGHQTFTYEALGLVLRLFEKRVAFGLYTLLPNKNFTTFNTFFANEKDQYFTNSLHPEMYGDRMTAVSVAGALGFKLHETFSIGLGATIGLKALADADAFVADASHLEDIDLVVKARAKVMVVPHLGLSWKPIRRLRLTGTVHAPQVLNVQAGFRFVLASATESGSGLAFSYAYQPWQVGGGASFDLIDRQELTLTAAGSLLYGRWSQYIDRQSIRPSGAYEWDDTLSAALGLRAVADKLSVALDGQYKPTPVPLQTGRYNYVDNDRIGLALAVDYAFTALKQKMKIGLMLQGYRLLERRQTKLETPTFADGANRTPQLVTDEVPDDAVQNRQPVPGREGLQTNNPGWPGFSSVGWVSSAGLYLTVLL